MRNLVHEVLHEVFEKVLYSVYYETRDEKQNTPFILYTRQYYCFSKE